MPGASEVLKVRRCRLPNPVRRYARTRPAKEEYCRLVHRHACRATLARLLIDLQHVLVGHQRPREVIEFGQVAAKDQRRAPKSPTACIRSAAHPAYSATGADRPSRDAASTSLQAHVGIRPTARLHIPLPCGDAVKFLAQAEWKLGVIRFVLRRPHVPMIVSNAPHLRVLRDFGCVIERSGTRRQAQHNRPSRLANRFRNLPNLCRPVRMVADAIHLDVIEAPARIEFHLFPS